MTGTVAPPGEARPAGDDRPEPLPTVVRGGATWLLAVVLVLTGSSALVLQVTWQRTIALHSGIDLSSATTVVAAFLAGLGLGSLLGGRIADRVDPLRALLVLAGTEVAVGVLALVSTPVLYDAYRALAPRLTSTAASFAFHATVLVVPTTLMGMSLPLAARAATGDVGRAGAVVGRLHAANTAGAAIGATVGGWYLLGELGFVGTARLVAGVQVLAALVLLGLAVATGVRSRARIPLGRAYALGGALGLVGAAAWALVVRPTSLVRSGAPLALAGAAASVVLLATSALLRRGGGAGAPRTGARPAPVEQAPVTSPAGVGGSVWPWFVAYGASGAVALGFEQVFFRLIDGVLRSNTYTFAHVLALYLVLLAVGTGVGSALVGRVRDPRRSFLWIQVGVGLSAVLSLVVLMDVLPALGLDGRLDAWFASDGFASGVTGRPLGDLVVFGVGVPLLLMAPPVVLMGAGFPFVQAVVVRDLARLGRGTGGLVCANLVGNVAGALVTGFVLIDRVGVAGSYLVLALPLLGAGFVAAALAQGRRRGLVQAGVAAGVLAAAVVALPSNHELWARLNGVDPDAVLVAEDRACASAVLRAEDGAGQLTLNATSQNGHPFDDFHVLIGLVPALAQRDPQRALAVGFGIGSTSHALLAGAPAADVTSVELCGGNYVLARELADGGEPDFVRLTEDPRHRELVGDGRHHLLVTDDRYDVVVPDHSRPTSAGAGNLYSREFYELIASRLTDDGLAAGWIPTIRVQNGVATTFPHAAVLTVSSYNESRFFVAGPSPFTLDPDVLVERYDRLAADAFVEPQRSRLRRYLADLRPECLTDGAVAPDPAPGAVNRDLHPRDEYFLAAEAPGPGDVVRTCGP